MSKIEIRPRFPEYFEPYVKALKQLSIEELEGFLENRTTTVTQGYESRGILTALNADGILMTLEQYCNFYGLDRTRAKSSKLVTHTGVPYYNIAFDDRDNDISEIDVDEIKSLLAIGLAQTTYIPTFKQGIKVGVVKIADLHVGAFIENMLKTKDYNSSILSQRLQKAAEIINRLNYGEVHVHVLGDLIESFTGLNHKNSWRNMEKGMVGAEAVKTATLLLHTFFLSKIHNLKTVKIIAGNHDRVTSGKDEDVNGDAANLISWGLSLIGYDVEFSSSVLTHYVDGINHINTHGHLGISRMSTKNICWDYGKQGVFNLIAEGHLHSIIQKLSVSQLGKFSVVKDAAVDHCRFNCPSFFTGNDFSEYLGYTSTAGFVVIENNGEGVPHQFNFSL